MDNNQFNTYGNKNSTKEIFKWVGLGLVSLGTLLVFIFSSIVCARGLKVYNGNMLDKWKKGDYKYSMASFGMSKWLIAVIIAVVLVIAGIVLSILAIDKANKISKVVIISIAVGAFALLYAAFTNITICSYNCGMNCKIKSEVKKESKKSGIDLDDLYDYADDYDDWY